MEFSILNTQPEGSGGLGRYDLPFSEDQNSSSLGGRAKRAKDEDERMTVGLYVYRVWI